MSITKLRKFQEICKKIHFDPKVRSSDFEDITGQIKLQIGEKTKTKEEINWKFCKEYPKGRVIPSRDILPATLTTSSMHLISHLTTSKMSTIFQHKRVTRANS